MLKFAAVIVLALATSALAEKTKPIVAGNLVVDPRYIVAVFRPVDQRELAIYIGKPGQAIQSILVADVREATILFDAIWNNDAIVKNPGDDDARPLTRMVLKDAENKIPTFIVNVDRILALTYDPNRREASIYLDRPSIESGFDDPTEKRYVPFLRINDVRDEALQVVNAYKACVYNK
jgi:hypothetical protein